ncbi:MAG: SMC-Scp complex subunit ScpB [Alphaproteobacteria bacterium]|nr:SMC-Scp complex subunit ScpB [Alphaproteobacteria bacterium]
MSDERPPGDEPEDLPPPVAELRPLPEEDVDDGESVGPDDTRAMVDNLIMLPGVERIPEPSPIRHGGPVRPPRVVPFDDDGDEDGGDDDGLEALDATRPPPQHLLDSAIEALLFAADRPLTESSIDRLLANPGVAEVRACLDLLARRYAQSAGGIRLVQVAHGWQLRTDPRFAPWVAAMRGGKPVKLSRAALEVLAIVGYRQPATKSEIDDLRGVDSGGVLRMLVERSLVAVTGRKNEPGRPLVYGTTPTFLSMFGLRDLSDLPTLRDLRELQDDDPRLSPLGRDDRGPQQLPLPHPELVGRDRLDDDLDEPSWFDEE